MTSCREFRELISASLDQPLPPEAEARLTAHLSDCPECQATLRDFRLVHQQIKNLQSVDPPPWLTSKIMARVRSEAAPRRTFWERFLRPLVVKPQFQVATILLLAGTSYYLLKTHGSIEPSVARSANQSADLMAPQKSMAAPQTESQKQQVEALASKPAELQIEPQNESRRRKKDADFAAPPPSLSSPPSAKAEAQASTIVGVVAENRTNEVLKLDAPKQEPSKEWSQLPSAAPAPKPATMPTPLLDKVERSEARGSLARSDKKSSHQVAGADAPADEKKSKDAEADSRDALSQVIPLVIRWKPTEPQSARASIAKEFSRLGASVLAQPEDGSKRVLTARLDARRLPELLAHLARNGTIREKPEPLKESSGLVTVSIRW